ncbi:MAG: FkbM family methyltransferase [Actinomycetota bacterium]
MGELDYRRSRTERRRSWYGLKRQVKRVLSLRLPHAVLRAIVRVRPELGRGGRLPAPARLREAEGEALGRRYVMLRPDRCEIAKELYWGRGRRPRPEDAFAIDLFARLAERSDAIVDIGAYTGVFTLVGTAVNPRIRADSFEIVPDVFQALFENCVRNDVLHRTTLHHVGVGRPGDLMRVPARTAGSALPSYYSRSLHFEAGVLVEFVSLDSLVPLFPPGNRVLVKVDVEGTENDVFRHGQAFLSSLRPDVLCEVLAGVADVEELQELLGSGYSYYLVRDSSLAPGATIEPSARFRDWFFTSRTPDELAALGIQIAEVQGQ